MINLVMSEEAIHYIARMLDHFQDMNQTKRHEIAMKEIRTVSDKLLEHLHEPARISIHRHLSQER
jgi:hypothetical protein